MAINPSSGSVPVSRRGFVGVLTGAAAAVGLGNLVTACRFGPIGKATSPGPDGRTTFITPNDGFYLVAVNPGFRPKVTAENVDSDWSLAVNGFGDKRRQLSYRDLKNMRSVEFLYTFECIGNAVGGDLIGNARWRGVPLKELLTPVLPDSRSGYTVKFRGLDNFFSSVSIERCLSDDSFIAFEMNGEPIPAGHGFPARVILPDLYGMKQPRWLKSIELVESPAPTGYWDRRGWASEVAVKTMSRIDQLPRAAVVQGEPYQLTGIAFAGARGIAKVEISLDDGRSWADCRLIEDGGAGVWALWAYEWRVPRAGRHALMCRATDRAGRVQTARRQGSYPAGATGYHRMSVRVDA